ncbi:MAG: histidine phosphatase family protein [Cyclobacteriaceae bacterium]
MSIKKIYIIRHGQTDFNLQGIVQGSGVDSSLNSTGQAQARAFFKMYRDVPYDKIYTSALKRTKESVQDFISMGIPHESLTGLNEISWGSKEGQRITPEEDAYYHWMLKEWQSGNTAERIEGGESPNDVVLRQRPAIDYILSKEDEKTILICMHGRAMRILLCELLNYPLKCMDMFEHQNLCLYQLDFTGSMFSIKMHNDKSHLKELNFSGMPHPA